MQSQQIKYTSFLPPGLSVVDGQKYVIPGWHKVSMDTTLEEVYTHWSNGIKKKEKDMTIIERDVISERSGEVYKVVYANGVWGCSCVGFGFRRTCKHIQKIKNEYFPGDKVKE